MNIFSDSDACANYFTHLCQSSKLLKQQVRGILNGFHPNNPISLDLEFSLYYKTPFWICAAVLWWVLTTSNAEVTKQLPVLDILYSVIHSWSTWMSYLWERGFLQTAIKFAGSFQERTIAKADDKWLTMRLKRHQTTEPMERLVSEYFSLILEK